MNSGYCTKWTFKKMEIMFSLLQGDFPVYLFPLQVVAFSYSESHSRGGRGETAPITYLAFSSPFHKFPIGQRGQIICLRAEPGCEGSVGAKASCYLSKVLDKQTNKKGLLKMLVYYYYISLFLWGTASQVQNKWCESKLLENNFYVNWEFPVSLSGAMSGSQEVIYPLLMLIKMEYL